VYDAQTDARERHDDITRIVRGINFALASPALSLTPTSGNYIPSRSTAPSLAPLSITIPPPGQANDDDEESPPRPFFHQAFFRPPQQPQVAAMPGLSLSDEGVGGGSSEDSSNSSYDVENQSIEATVRAAAALKLDESGRIASYVDFRDVEAALSAMSVAEREALEAELEPRRDFETIPEERESPFASASPAQPSLVH